MPSTKHIRWGIIGLGKIANKFAQDLRFVPNCSLYGVASRYQEKANSFAKQYDAPIAYDSYEALAKNPEIDAIYIATPHSFHLEHALMCLSHKKAVLCEKPLAMNSVEVEAMINMARANNVLLMEALWTYFLPHFNFVRNTIQLQTYGTVQKLEADFGFQPQINPNSRAYNKQQGGGSLMDVGIYPIFVALSTLGNPIDLDAKATFFKSGVDSSTAMIFEYESGTKAFLNSSFLEASPTTATFYCEKAIIKINSRFHAPTTVSLIKDGKEDIMDFGYTTQGYSYEVEHFNDLLRKGLTESPVMTFNFSRLLIETLDKVRANIGLNY